MLLICGQSATCVLGRRCRVRINAVDDLLITTPDQPGAVCGTKMTTTERSSSALADGAGAGPKKPLTSAQVQQSFRDRQKACIATLAYMT